MSTPTLSSAARGLLLTFLVGIAGAGPAAAQSQCVFGEGTRSADSRLVSGRRIAYMSTPHLVCNDGVEIWADSAVAYVTENWAYFMGNVRFEDETRELEAREARYYTRQGRLQAEGSLVLRDTLEGSVIENGDLLYLRRGDIRFEEEITVTTGADGVRPRLTFLPTAPADSAQAQPSGAGEPPDSVLAAPEPAVGEPVPLVVDADRLELRGQGYFKAIGAVEMRRDSVLALADSAEYDRAGGLMILQDSASVAGSSFDLSGRRVELGLGAGRIDEARALGDAVLVGAGMRLESPQIRVYLRGGALERLVAVPMPPAAGAPRGRARRTADAGPQPVAVAEDFRLWADSIDVLAPGEVLERIFAAGRARSESAARDSLNVEALPTIARRDWLEGDTVIATFEPVDGPGERVDSTAGRYRLSRLVARVTARSLYRLPPSDSTARAGRDAPAVHYVRGAEIVIVMADGEVERMEVEGLIDGMHLEPMRRSGPDTTTAVRPVGRDDRQGERPPTRTRKKEFPDGGPARDALRLVNPRRER